MRNFESTPCIAMTTAHELRDRCDDKSILTVLKGILGLYYPGKNTIPWAHLQTTIFP